MNSPSRSFGFDNSCPVEETKRTDRHVSEKAYLNGEIKFLKRELAKVRRLQNLRNKRAELQRALDLAQDSVAHNDTRPSHLR